MKAGIEPEDIFLDSANLPSFNIQQLEGAMERPLSKNGFKWLWFGSLVFMLTILARTGELQLAQGETLASRSKNNSLRQIPVFAERGIIYDRFGTEMAWNETSGRRYLEKPGFANLLGYTSYPTITELTTQDYDPKEPTGRDGAERAFNAVLEGERGIKVEEIDVYGNPISEYIFKTPTAGKSIYLSIDSRLQEQLYRSVDTLVNEGKFTGGSAALLDVYTGELLAAVTVPEYDSNVLSAGTDRILIQQYLTDPAKPFLNRLTAGLYTPGSVIKPIIALGALNERIIDPNKKILSAGSITIPNPYFPEQPSVFKDWKVHGWVDMKQAIAHSSDVYFYTIGGGFKDQIGLGITKIEQYATLFGLGQKTDINFGGEQIGIIPTPAWKAKNFNGEPWRLGNTYHTVIGQYGFQVTPLQLVRAVAAIATNGFLVKPTLLAVGAGNESLVVKKGLGIQPEYFEIVKAGMRLAVTEGTAQGLNLPGIEIAAKTGTAEIGVQKAHINSLVIGFFPYQKPRYAFAAVMENGASGQLIGAVFVMRQFLDWLRINAPEYFSLE